MPRSTPLVVLAVVLVGCGGGGQGNGRKDPEALLREVAAALRQVHSLHYDGTVVTREGRFRLSGDVAANGDVRYRLGSAGQRMEMVSVGRYVYLRANGAFWRRNGATAIAHRVADRWVKAPAQALTLVRAGLDQVRPRGLAECISRPTGKLSYRGTATVDGKRTVVVVDGGDRPGDAPGVIYVQADGPALPLRSVQTGPVTPGAERDPSCGGVGPTPTSGELRFSRFDEDVRITVPEHALDLGNLAGVRQV
jgi:hypothetical protein